MKQEIWQDYDPSWLVEAAERVSDLYPWLPEQLTHCTKAKQKSQYYIYFIEFQHPNQANSKWQFKTNIVLETQQYGDVVLDILEGNIIGGVEFLSELTNE